MEYVHFAEKLTLHAQNEEEVLYLTAIVIGDYLKHKLKKKLCLLSGKHKWAAFSIFGHSFV